MTDLLGELQKLQRSPTVVTPTQPDVPSIAVLPFANMSADPEYEYFCEGLAEELIDALARSEGLHVVARTSGFQLRGKGHDLREIREKLKVKTVLEGSVRKAGNRLRINAHLINADDGYHLWSERYDRDMDDVFAVQDDIAQTVVEKLKVKRRSTVDTPLIERPTDNLEAYNLCLKGRYYLVRFTRATLEKGLECFTQAVALDPTYAQAHAGLAQLHMRRAVLRFAAPHTLMPEAKEAALKAIAIDETVAEAHVALAMVLHYYEWNGPGAEREYRRALALNPGDTIARANYALLLGQAGRADVSVAEARSAVERDPLSTLNQFVLATVFVTARRFDEAIAESHAGIELDPSYQLSYVSLGWGLAGLGRYNEAVETLRQSTIVAPDDSLLQGYFGWALGLAGQRREALTILDNLERRRSHTYVGGVLLAQVSLGLGEHDQAISWLRQAAEERDGLMTCLTALFLVDPLRADPRFQALLRRMRSRRIHPKRNWRRLRKPGVALFNSLRRRVEQHVDQAWTLTRWKMHPRPLVAPFDGDPRFALLTVNFSTTRYLKLMLLTLCEQRDLHRIYRIVIVDNDSRDGGLPFLRRLAAGVDRVHLVEQRFFPTHARGLRRGVAFLDGCEASDPPDTASNLLLVCDTDIIFLNPQTLTDLAVALTARDAVFAGELRHYQYPYPQAQASFFAVRRDCYARPDVPPFVNHGNPAYWMQRGFWRAGLGLADFPSNHGGYILHRGRSGVAAARQYRPLSTFQTADTHHTAHYMGVHRGAQLWNTTERRYSEWLRPERDTDLLDYLAKQLRVLGRQQLV